jgi:hypothetical protein
MARATPHQGGFEFRWEGLKSKARVIATSSDKISSCDQKQGGGIISFAERIGPLGYAIKTPGLCGVFFGGQVRAPALTSQVANDPKRTFAPTVDCVPFLTRRPVAKC